MLVRSGGEEFPLRLADAKKIEIAPCDTGAKTGVKITLGQWRHKDAELDLTLYLTVCLEGKDEDLVFDIAARKSKRWCAGWTGRLPWTPGKWITRC